MNTNIRKLVIAFIFIISFVCISDVFSLNKSENKAIGLNSTNKNTRCPSLKFITFIDSLKTKLRPTCIIDSLNIPADKSEFFKCQGTYTILEKHSKNIKCVYQYKFKNNRLPNKFVIEEWLLINPKAARQLSIDANKSIWNFHEASFCGDGKYYQSFFVKDNKFYTIISRDVEHSKEGTFHLIFKSLQNHMGFKEPVKPKSK